MQEHRDECQYGRLLAAVLRGRGRKDRSNLADKRAAHPKRAGLVEEVLHLRGHVSVPRAGAKDDRVVFRKLVPRCDSRLLVELEAGLARDLLRTQFGSALDHGFGAGLAHAFGDSFRHALDVAVSGIVKYQNLRHFFAPIIPPTLAVTIALATARSRPHSPCTFRRRSPRHKTQPPRAPTHSPAARPRAHPPPAVPMASRSRRHRRSVGGKRRRS